MKIVIYILLTIVLITESCSKDIDMPPGRINPICHKCEIKPGWDMVFAKYICEKSSMHILEFKSFKELNEVADFFAKEVYNDEILDIYDLNKMYEKYYQYTYYDYETFYDSIGGYHIDWYHYINTNVYYFTSLYSFYSDTNEAFGGDEQRSNEVAEGIRLRYSYFFLFSDKDPLSTKPYIAMKNKNHAYVANIYGRVIVGGIEHNLNDCMSFDELN